MTTLTRTDPLIEELMATEGKAEIIGGQVVKLMSTGRFPGRTALKIVASLLLHEESVGGGIAIGGNVGFLCGLPNRHSFSPDAAFYIGPGEEEDAGFLPEPPIFAVEVRSENDYGRRADVVWDVDVIHGQVIAKFTAPDAHNPQLFRRGQIADAETAVPGWTLAVERLFPTTRHN